MQTEDETAKKHGSHYSPAQTCYLRTIIETIAAEEVDADGMAYINGGDALYVTYSQATQTQVLSTHSRLKAYQSAATTTEPQVRAIQPGSQHGPRQAIAGDCRLQKPLSQPPGRHQHDYTEPHGCWSIG